MSKYPKRLQAPSPISTNALNDKQDFSGETPYRLQQKILHFNLIQIIH